MKYDKIQDERIITARRKIQSECFQLLIIILSISGLVQLYFLKAPFSQYAVEFFCLIGCGIYVSIRNFTLGINQYPTEQKNTKNFIKSAFITGVIFIISFVFLSGENDINLLVILFTCFILFQFLSQIFFQYINRKKQNELDTKMNQDEMDLNE